MATKKSTPKQPESIAVALTAEQWRDVVALMELGTKAGGFKLFKTAGELIENILKQAPQLDQSSPA